MATSQTPATVSDVAKMEVSYTTLGQEIKLNANIVRKYLTRGNVAVTDQEVLQFISICKYQQLNPFLNEAYLVKFKNNQGGEDNAQIITSKEAFMKRAEGNENYKGLQAGLILKRGDQVVYEEGEFMLQTDVLLGGWAKVYRSDRDYPYTAYVNLTDYDKKRNTWNAIKCTMIRKTAIVHALREAFPTQLGALYTVDDNPQIEDINYEEVHNDKVRENANKEQLPEEKETHAAEAPAAPENSPAPDEGKVPTIFDQQ